MDNKPLESIPKLLTIFTSACILAGVVSTTVYYHYFSIDILNFIGISEVLTLFVSDFSTLVITITIMVVWGWLIPPVQSLERLLKFSYLFSNSKPIFFVDFISVMGFSLLTLYSFKGFPALESWAIIKTFFLRVLGITILYARMYRRYPAGFIGPVKIFHIFVFLFAIISIAFVASISALRTLEENPKTKIALINAKGETVQSDTTTIFVGKSKDFIFLYHIVDKKSIILQSNKYEKIEYSKTQ